MKNPQKKLCQVKISEVPGVTPLAYEAYPGTLRSQTLKYGKKWYFSISVSNKKADKIGQSYVKDNDEVLIPLFTMRINHSETARGLASVLNEIADAMEGGKDPWE